MSYKPKKYDEPEEDLDDFGFNKYDIELETILFCYFLKKQSKVGIIKGIAILKLRK